MERRWSSIGPSLKPETSRERAREERSRMTLPVEIREKAEELLRRGLSQRRVAESLGVSRGFVENVAREPEEKICSRCGASFVGSLYVKLCDDCLGSVRRGKPKFVPSPEHIERETKKIRERNLRRLREKG